MKYLCHTTTDAIEQADEEILIPRVPDEALEAAVGGFILPSLTSQAPRGNQCC